MSHDDKDRPLGADVDLDAWEPAAPPRDFAERVLRAVSSEPSERVERVERRERAGSLAPADEELQAAPARARARRWGVATAVVGALALAAALALRVGGGVAAPRGEAIAKDRLEVSVGARAKAVLEPGAAIQWKGDDVVQAHGDVFYRVEPGARFRVHTPAGDVEVKGTCFTVKIRGEGKDAEGEDMNKRDVKSGAIGAALSALAFVAVYEGKVAVSHASDRADLAAGESAELGAGGVSKSATLGAGQKAFDAKLAEAQASGSSTDEANANLVAQVSEYRRRLEAIATQKAELEQKLDTSEKKLASTQDGGGVKKGEFDLSQEDWADLAKQGRVAYRVPCDGREGWTPSPDKLQKLGLAPQDGPVIREAYAKSSQRIWAQIGPLCTAALGGNAPLAEKLGASTCQHLIYDVERAISKDATEEAMTQVAEVRAGQRPEPGANEKVSPVFKMFMALTGANKAFENDLAQALGPDEAHRLAHSTEMCNSDNRWGGGKKRTPAAP